MLAERPDERICVVTHGGFLRILVGVIVFGRDFNKKQFFDMRERMRTVNTGITAVDLKEGAWRLITWNDISHFG
jgi:broad specificity phosphatase PhoE